MHVGVEWGTFGRSVHGLLMLTFSTAVVFESIKLYDVSEDNNCFGWRPKKTQWTIKPILWCAEQVLIFVCGGRIFGSVCSEAALKRWPLSYFLVKVKIL